MFSPADAIRFKALEKDVANLRTLIRIEALEKENANLRYVHRGRGGRGGRRGAANSNEQEPRLCVVCGTAEHLAEGCPHAHPTAVARIKKRRENARAWKADECRDADHTAVARTAQHTAHTHECRDADHTAVARTAQHTVHFHPATIFLNYHKPVTRRRRLNELPIDLRWQACVLKMSNKTTLMHRRVIRGTDVVYRTYKAAARYAAPWFSFWHSHHAKTASAKHARGILRRKRTPGAQLLHQANDITVMSVSKHLAANTEHPAMRSAHHGGSIVHLYQSQVQIERPRLGACVDTGAQLGSASHDSEILAHTGDTLNMLGATGHTAALNGILMGVETVDDKGKSLVVVVPNTSVSNPKAAESLVPAGPLMEAGFLVDFRTPSDAAEDGYAHMPFYGGTIVTPAPSRVIIMEYKHSTWRLPLPHAQIRTHKAHNFTSLNAFSSLQNLNDAVSTGGVHDKTNSVRSEEDQRRFELKCAREKEVAMLHDVSHRHNRGLLNDLIAAGVETRHLKRYILKHNCKWCAANRGKRQYLTKSHVIPSGEILISTIVDPQDPNTTITETLAKQFQSTSPMYSVRSLEDVTVAANSPSTSTPILEETIDSPSLMQAPPINLLPQSQSAQRQTDLHADWADAASLGWNGERYFLLIVDKETEYLANFNTKARTSPVQLVKEFITATGRSPRYLRVDGAKEFVSDEMKALCVERGIVLQVVVAYNHTMQARVEAAIGYVKQHSRISLLRANAPTRWWPDATTDFVLKKNFLWYSQEANGKFSTAHQRIQSSFAGTRASVSLPFGCHITSTIPREHRLVVNGSFGDRFIEGIFLHADQATPGIWMYDFKSKSRYMVKDWTPYPDEFPLRDPSCLLRPASSTAVDVAAMHAEDARDDSLIAQEQAVAALTRAQSKAISAATNSPLDFQPSALADKPKPSLDTALEAPSPSSPPETTSRQTPLPAGSPLDMPFTEMSELDLARALLKHNYPIVLPTRYAPFDKPTPEGKMVVVGVKAQKTSATKAVLWVRFTSPPSYVGHQIQLYPKSLEPKNGPAKGADFSILSALASMYPQATTLRHLGITEQTRCRFDF